MVGGEKAGMGNREWGMEDRQGGECTGGGGGTATHGFAQPHRPQRNFIPYSLFPIPAPPASPIVLGNLQPARLVLLPALAPRAARPVVGGARKLAGWRRGCPGRVDTGGYGIK